MHVRSIRTKLTANSIVQNRITTLRREFASAEASIDPFDLATVNEALKELYGTEPTAPLKCVYCDLPAKTWDHFHRIVKDGKYSGYGHRIRNLVPCCKDCNSSKSEDWEPWLRQRLASRGHEATDIESRIHRIRKYTERLAPDSEATIPRELREQYTAILDQIIHLCGDADVVAGKIRDARQKHQTETSSIIIQNPSERSSGHLSSAADDILTQNDKANGSEGADNLSESRATASNETEAYRRAWRAVNAKPGTVGHYANLLLREVIHSANGLRRGHSYRFILKRLKEQFPSNEPTMNTLRWYESKLRTVYGKDAVPPRQNDVE